MHSFCCFVKNKKCQNSCAITTVTPDTQHLRLQQDTPPSLPLDAKHIALPTTRCHTHHLPYYSMPNTSLLPPPLLLSPSLLLDATHIAVAAAIVVVAAAVLLLSLFGSFVGRLLLFSSLPQIESIEILSPMASTCRVHQTPRPPYHSMPSIMIR